jgi:hypothetical protein
VLLAILRVLQQVALVLAAMTWHGHMGIGKVVVK